MITLTDGQQEVKAMEYSNIPELTTSLPPGTKVCMLSVEWLFEIIS